jgi:methylase of polypeptide subunit release factors
MIKIHNINEFDQGNLVQNLDFATQDPDLLFTKTWTTNDILVYYHMSLDGGGMNFSSQYREVIQAIYGNRKFSNAFEWCSGPGYIGFDLLSHNVCDQLWLGDIYQPALRAINCTIENLPEHYHNRVNPFHMKSVADIPSDVKFDLIVSNPPHWDLNQEPFINQVYFNFNARVCADTDWTIHADFFQNIKKHLAPDGVILLLEHSFGSGPDSFRSFIEEGGLQITNCYWEPDVIKFYYLEVQHQ